jgi:putative membrane protein
VKAARARVEPAHLGLVAGAGLVFVWSAVRPHDYFTWFLEVAPAIIGFAVLAWTYHRFRLTTLAYALCAVHAAILMVGGHYTYAEVPLFDWLRDAFGLARNDYDRVGHFAQGFVPAILAREVLLRRTPLARDKWLVTLVLAVALAISALYELLEWGVASATGGASDAFLGTQGDVWDTQKDMATCLVGAITSLALLSRAHDRALAAGKPSRLPPPVRD